MTRRPFLSLFTALCIGVVLADHNPLFYYILSALTLLGALFLWMENLGNRFVFLCMAGVLGISFGFVYRTYELKHFEPDPNLLGKPIVLKGTLYGIDHPNNTLYTLKGDASYRIYLRDNQGKKFNGMNVVIEIDAYDVPQVTNPGDFDYKEYLNSLGHHSQFYVDSSAIHIVGERKWGYDSSLNVLRQQIYEGLLSDLSEERAGLTYGMLLGDTRFIDKELRTDFVQTGIAHVLAMSGLHFGILYGLMEVLRKKLNLENASARIVVLGMLWFLAALNGFKPSALRAVVMISAVAVAPLLGRRYDVLNILGMIGCASLLKYAGSIYQPGLQLSYVAVLAIVFLVPLLEQRIPWRESEAFKLALLAVGIQLGMAPVLAYHFHYHSLVSYLLNIPAVFLAGLIVPLGFMHLLLGLLLPIATPVSCFMLDAFLELLILTSRFLKGTSLQGFYTTRPSLLFIGVYFWVLMLMVWDHQFNRFFRGKLKMGAALMVIVPVLLLGLSPFQSSGVELIFWDVGQGDSTLIKHQTQRILIDTGSEDAQIYQKLLNNGVYGLDYLILSHGHDDHAGGALDLLQNLSVKHLVLGAYWKEDPLLMELIQAAERRNTEVVFVDSGMALEWPGGLKIKCLYPKYTLLGDAGSVNDSSLCLLLSYGGYRCLFTGDIETVGENTLEASGGLGDVDVLKVPHHGSNTSSSEGFVDAVNPKVAIIQVGENRYGHPHHAVTELYEAKGVQLYRTDEDGAIQVFVKKDSYDIIPFVGGADAIYSRMTY